MKKLFNLIIVFAVILTVLSSCSYNLCPTYSQHNKATKYGQKAQAHYTKKSHRGRW